MPEGRAVEVAAHRLRRRQRHRHEVVRLLPLPARHPHGRVGIAGCPRRRRCPRSQRLRSPRWQPQRTVELRVALRGATTTTARRQRQAPASPRRSHTSRWLRPALTAASSSPRASVDRAWAGTAASLATWEPAPSTASPPCPIGPFVSSPETLLPVDQAAARRCAFIPATSLPLRAAADVLG